MNIRTGGTDSILCTVQVKFINSHKFRPNVKYASINIGNLNL